MFGTWLKERRLGLGLTQTQTAEAIGVTQQAYGRWENNQRLPSDLVVLDRLAILLDVELHELAEQLAVSDGEVRPEDQANDGVEARLARIEQELRRLGGSL